MNKNTVLVPALVVAGVLLTGCHWSRTHVGIHTHPQHPPPGPARGHHEHHHFIYYPAHEMYYCDFHREYVYVEHRAWVWKPAPPADVSVRVLAGAVSVELDFHDDPSLHHVEVVKVYPKDHGHPPGWARGKKKGWYK